MKNIKNVMYDKIFYLYLKKIISTKTNHKILNDEIQYMNINVIFKKYHYYLGYMHIIKK